MPEPLREGDSAPRPVSVERISVPLVKAIVAGAAVLTLVLSAVTAWQVLSGSLAQHVGDANVHVPADHYRRHGDPVGVHDMERFKLEVSAKISAAVAPLQTQMREVQETVEDAHQDDPRFRRRRARRARAAATD